jgi:hypothetical protein
MGLERPGPNTAGIPRVSRSLRIIALGENRRFGPAYDESISPLEEVSDNLRKGLWPFNHKGVARVVHERQMRAGNQLLVNTPGRWWDHPVARPE